MMLGEVTVSETQLTIGGIVALLGALAAIRGFIRKEAGVSETTNVALSPTNDVTVAMKVKYAPLEEIARIESYIHKINHDLLGELNEVKLAVADRTEQAKEDLKDLTDTLAALSVKVAEVKTQGDTQATLLTEVRQLNNMILQRLPRTRGGGQ